MKRQKRSEALVTNRGEGGSDLCPVVFVFGLQIGDSSGLLRLTKLAGESKDGTDVVDKKIGYLPTSSWSRGFRNIVFEAFVATWTDGFLRTLTDQFARRSDVNDPTHRRI